MTVRTLFAVVAVAQFVAWPAVADNAHIYQGGPKSGIPHAMRYVESGPYAMMTSNTTNGHHYQGGPNTGVPHHMKSKR